MAVYSYRLRGGGLFGISVTRFAKDQQPQQLTTENVDSGADIRKELRASQVSGADESIAKILTALTEVRKLANTIVATIDNQTIIVILSNLYRPRGCGYVHRS